MLSSCASSPTLVGVGLQSVLVSPGFMLVCDRLSRISHGDISVYTDGSLMNLGTRNCAAGAGVFFSDIDLSLGIGMSDLLSSTLAEIQAIALALVCVPSFSSVCLFSDSQAALDAYAIARASSHSGWFLPSHLNARFLLVDGRVISGNFRHFVHDIFCSVCYAHWEVGSGSKFLPASSLVDVNWFCSLLVWHLDSHMAAGHTSKPIADAHTFFMKTLYHWLPVAIRKHLYNRWYSSVLCLYYGKMETSDHVFSCEIDKFAHLQILSTHFKSWIELSGLSLSSFCMLQLLSSCASDISVSMALFKGFVFSDWSQEAVNLFKASEVVNLNIVEFVRSLGLAFKSNIWLVWVKYHVFMERNNLIPLDGSFSISVPGSAFRISAGVVRLLGVAEACGVHFGFCKHCSFFSGIGDSVSVHIAV
ncbi:hypothetical protein G9A89_023550 [Geosiphon pyriformis]|nr:hypothetical protein G9A89_023550 [Geosiphon pyriformis]